MNVPQALSPDVSSKNNRNSLCLIGTANGFVRWQQTIVTYLYLFGGNVKISVGISYIRTCHTSPEVIQIERCGTCQTFGAKVAQCNGRFNSGVAAMEILALVRWRVLLISIGLICAAGGAYATPIVFSGSLVDNGNTALVGSGAAPAAPGFADMGEVANNVALYNFSVAKTGNVEFKSLGFASGGIDPYFTLFNGLGSSATFLASNYDNAFFFGGGDFVLSLALAIGDYTIAIGDFANMSFAENLGSGVLGDGFVGIGSPDSLGDASYALVVTLPANGGGSVPEPATLLLVLTGLAAMWRVMGKGRTHVVTMPLNS